MDWNDVFTGRQREKLLTETISKIAGLYNLAEQLGDRKKDELKGFYGDEDKIDDMEVAGFYGDGDKLVCYGVALYQKMFFPSVPKPSPPEPHRPYLYELVAPENLPRVAEKYRMTPKLVADAMERLKEKFAKKKDNKEEIRRAAEELQKLAESPAVADLIHNVTLGRTSMIGGDCLTLGEADKGDLGGSGICENGMLVLFVEFDDYRFYAEEYRLRAEVLAELRAKIER